MIRVVVLGCGPAGLLAAHAASLQGADVRVFSIKQPSMIGGAQFLHESIPGLTANPDGHILFIKKGNGEGYAKKLYGDRGTPTSWDKFDDPVSKPAWGMQRCYKMLWQMYRQNITHYEVKTPRHILEIERLGADLYVTTLPANFLCENGHIFEAVPIWIYHGLLKNVNVPVNTVIYNGHEAVPWVRASNLFGYKSMEFPSVPNLGSNAKMMKLQRGFKPTAHDCDCNPQWMRVGRFGQWKRGVLVHHAFREVTHALQQMQ